MADEKKYIEANAYAEKLEAYKCGVKDFDEALDLAVSTLAVFPAADVRPVVHEKWNCESRYTARCSKCRFPVYPKDRTRYCPNCGAKMTVIDKNTGKREAAKR